ncbi:MAG: hypothetical protein Q9162_000335 [Coniocarpon cinnabarinum]
MGLFNTRSQSKRSSGEFRWPFKPIDPSTPPRPKSKRDSLKISAPVLVQSTQAVSNYPPLPSTAPLPQSPHTRTSSNNSNTSSNRHPHHFEPLWRDSYVSHKHQSIPFDLCAASAAQFHDYLKEMSSEEPSYATSDYEQEELDILDLYHETEIAKPVSLIFPGKPRVINVSPPSSFGSSRSAASSSSDVRTSGFLESRRNSDDSNSHCDTPFTPYTPSSFFDTSDDSTPSEELDRRMSPVYQTEFKPETVQHSHAQHMQSRPLRRDLTVTTTWI